MGQCRFWYRMVERFANIADGWLAEESTIRAADLAYTLVSDQWSVPWEHY
jgi:hypothetical protein